MKLTLLSQSELSSISLPEKHLGRYWISSINTDGKKMDIVSVEALRAVESGNEDKWRIKSNRRFTLVDEKDESVDSAELSLSKLYRIRSIDKKFYYTMFAEPLTDDRKQYKGYIVRKNTAAITIGREKNNCIWYANDFVSAKHAVLSFPENGIFLDDNDSTNHTYVNGKAIKKRQLFVGDVIYIMGLQIIITSGALFINNPDGKVKVQSPDLQEFKAPEFHDNSDNEFEEVPVNYYYRPLRFKHDVDEYELKVDAPPENSNNDDMPMIMLIGPSMTMGMASVASGAFTVTNAIEQGNISSAIPSLVMCISMLLGTIMWPIITKMYQKRLSKRKEAKRQEAYTAYLNEVEQLIARETTRQEQILRSNDVNTEICVRRIMSEPPQIWDRTPKHTDFLSLRLGMGNLPLKAKINYSERRFTVEHDKLTEMMLSLAEKQRTLTNVPICLPLTERFVSGIYGDKSILYSYAQGLILQLVTLHSYDEVKIVMIYDESRADDFSFARWLPHTMSDDRTVRYIATNSEEVKALSGTLDSIIEYRKELSDNKSKEESPYFVIICLDKVLASKAECVRRVLENKNNINFSVVTIYERLDDLPKECMAVAEINGMGGNLTIINNVSELPVPFKIDALQRINIEQVTGVLANTFVDTSGSTFALPKKYSFFEMLDIGMIEHLNLADNWSANDPVKSLAATVGIDKYGEPFKLDLHERAHGPHGLIAGMTGSGKSEFIISYILSMAVNFHPYEVAFILIDYKGGGMAKSFENIPHTAGVITNLDGNGIKRSLMSMKSELHRREKIFRDTSKRCSISNIDIYKYQKLFREGKVSEPLPHLFIISDEFAELKKEQPDFMTELTSTARVGRSLGVHLILATQKPGGVVDDQIRSNSRFKICLKVQDAGDSQEMLGRPEAAALVDTGRFYLQVGYNELFEMGQSAWAGAPYYPSQTTIKDRDDAVSVINTNGRVIAETNTDRFASVIDPPKQLDVITNYIANYCRTENIKRWKMWLDPILSKIYVDELSEKYKDNARGKFELAPIVGEYDDPAHQSQGILRIPMTEDGNVVVYGSSGSGKAMFVEAMLYSLMSEHTPNEVNIYIVDFGSETFTSFSESPYVGDVILSYETEKINNLLRLIAGKIETRKKILSGFGGDFVQYNIQAETPEPNIVVVINNFAAFNELYEDKLGDVNYLTREGPKYGIYFVVSCTGTNNIRFSMLQNFKLIYCLQMNNPDDYSAVVGKTEGLVPEKFKGRGIFRRDKDTLLEFQTASITRSESPYPSIREICKEQAKRYPDIFAAKVPILPEKVTQQFLLPYVRRGDLSKVPIGVEKSSLEVYNFNFSLSTINLVLSLEQDWNEFADAVSELVANHVGIKTIVLSPMDKNTDNFENSNLRICSDSVSCAAAVNDIFKTILQRNNEYKDKLSAGEEPPEYEPIFVIIKSISVLKKVLERYEPANEVEKTSFDDTLLNRLKLAMEKNNKDYNVYFTIFEDVGTIAPFAVESWYKTHINPAYGIWIGNGVNSQFRFTINKKPPEYSSEIGADFGFAINKSTAVLIKMLQE